LLNKSSVAAYSVRLICHSWVVVVVAKRGARMECLRYEKIRQL
jgi:hypothetical protein